jgi:hypothetical protein
VARKFKLSLRKTFRLLAQFEQTDWAREIRKATPPHSRDSKELMGGSLVAEIVSPKIIRVTRWGYVLDFFNLGGKGHLLTFFLRGAQRISRRTAKGRFKKTGRVRSHRKVTGPVKGATNVQPPRPLNVKDPTGRIIKDVTKNVHASFAAWDRQAKP